MTEQKRVLVIGCGSIGAQYDLHTHDVQTHARAWYINSNTSLTLFDINEDLSSMIAGIYKCKTLPSIDIEVLSSFDCISICTPTNTHARLLDIALKAGVKTIICEKPVSGNVCDLENLLRLYLNSQSKVLVNFIRRFQPAYTKLKNVISTIMSEEESLTNISIRYQRGFINNCSHAFDVLEFLLDRKVELKELNIYNKKFDQFDGDPTLSISALWNDVNFSVTGLANVLFSHFEIDIYFKRHKVSIRNAGNYIEVYKAEYSKNLQPLFKIQEFTECLKDYMKYVVHEATELIKDPTREDNFVPSVDLNMRMLKYLEL